MIWFTSDLHLGHLRIIELCHRPFSSVDQMNTEIINRWNSVIKPTDAVFVLGDLAMGKIADTLPLCKQLVGQKYLVPGNHDRCFSSNKKMQLDIYQEVGFTVLPELETCTYQDLTFRICHFPYVGDSHDEDRYQLYRPQPDGNWLIHGHTHSKWFVGPQQQIHVGVDAHNFYPVNINEIVAIMRE